LAETIAKGVENIEGVSAVLKNTVEVTKEDFVISHGIIAGSPVYFGLLAAELKENGIKLGQKVAELAKKLYG